MQDLHVVHDITCHVAVCDITYAHNVCAHGGQGKLSTEDKGQAKSVISGKLGNFSPGNRPEGLHDVCKICST